MATIYNYLVSFEYKFPWGDFKCKGVILKGKPVFHIYDAMKIADLKAPDSLVYYIETTSGRRILDLNIAAERTDDCKLRRWRARFIDYDQLILLFLYGKSDICIRMRKYLLKRLDYEPELLIKL